MAPTFRPDRYLEPAREGWRAALDRLGEVAGIDTGSYPGYVAALEARRRHFVEHGAVSADHGHQDAGAEPLSEAAAARIFRAAYWGDATEAEMVGLASARRAATRDACASPAATAESTR